MESVDGTNHVTVSFFGTQPGGRDLVPSRIRLDGALTDFALDIQPNSHQNSLKL